MNLGELSTLSGVGIIGAKSIGYRCRLSRLDMGKASKVLSAWCVLEFFIPRARSGDH
jgi:hypothetical protein